MSLDDAMCLPHQQSAPRTLVAGFIAVLVLALAVTVHFAIRSLDGARAPAPRPPATTPAEPPDEPSGAVRPPG